MFEYILAGFTGTFFSYFVVFWSGTQLHAFAKGTASDKVIEVMNTHHDILEIKMDMIERKLDLVLRQECIPNYLFPEGMENL
jgi:hypothetical protein